MTEDHGAANGTAAAHAGHGNAVAPGIFVVGGLALGIITKNLLQRTRLPYTVLLLVVGMIIEALHEHLKCVQ